MPPGTFEQGDSITVQTHVLNIGDEATGSFTLTVYASEDLFYSEDDVPIGSQERASLPFATSHDTPVEGTIPLDLEPGQYYVVGHIDFDDTFPQDNGTSTAR